MLFLLSHTCYFLIKKCYCKIGCIADIRKFYYSDFFILTKKEVTVSKQANSNKFVLKLDCMLLLYNMFKHKKLAS